jgi:hypothetical protein
MMRNILDAKKLDCIVTSRQVIVYDMKNFATVKWTNQILCYKQIKLLLYTFNHIFVSYQSFWTISNFT